MKIIMIIKTYMITVVLYLCKLILYNCMPHMYIYCLLLYYMSIVYVTCVLYIFTLMEPS